MYNISIYLSIYIYYRKNFLACRGIMKTYCIKYMYYLKFS